ncbi:methyltransferase domain-containing protein [Shimia sediminis]|uniref:methyltransferase domain-containing protein n=1 Tax=Shimia sediminis TaxID=2497945 RepID=UPI000F8C897D|nr:methyltransferase domain-containing protein [Shimia sediminis]
MGLTRFLNKLIAPTGKVIVLKKHMEMVYQHDYQGGYEQYRDVQIAANKEKLGNLWADEKTLSRVVDDLKARGLGATGICHGARNGYEVEFFRTALKAEVIGTDISETATQFDHMIVWDFHKENPDWANKFDFVYTNSLDQAMEPDRALRSWAKQLQPNGRIYIEHTLAHSAAGAGEMDPFGAHPMVMPYLFFKWGRGAYELDDILELESKANKDIKVWLFVLKPSGDAE